MGDKAALYLAHLNPMTLAHEAIISELKNEYKSVYVFPVRFVKCNKEVNTRSFPFSFSARRAMVQSLFGTSIQVLPDYTFESPYSKYLPPILSSRSWRLRNTIVSKIKESNFASYTGDTVERLMLLAYGLHPLWRERHEIDATSVREKLYVSAIKQTGSESWRKYVPARVADIIEKNWSVVDAFSKSQDLTKRILGMKFPIDGYKMSN